MTAATTAATTAVEPECSSGSGAIVLVLALCGTAVSLMQTVVVPLLPDFPGLLDTSPDNASWLVTVTLLTSAVTTPIMSRLADMHGKRRMIVVSLVALLCGSLLGATSDSLALLIVARLLQGFAPALIPIGISTMRDELPPDKIGGAVALMSATLGIGGAVGLPLSGVIYEAFGWQAVFWASVVMSVGMLVLVLSVVPESGVSTPGRFDWLGAVLISIALTALLLGISKSGAWGWTSQWTLLSFTVAALSFALWAPWELRTGEPLVDLRTSARRPVLLTNIASLLAGFVMFNYLLVATQQLQIPVVETGVGFGLGVTEAGLAMLPGGVLMVLMAPVSASITRRFGARITLTGGLSVTGLGYVVRVLLDGSLIELMVGVSIVSVGIAMSFAAMPVIIMQSVPIGETAAANGLNTVVRSIGTSTCSATVAAVLTAGMVSGGSYPSEAALHAMSWLAAVAAFLGAAVGFLIPARTAPVIAARAPGLDERPPVARGDAVRRADVGAEVVVRGRAQCADGRPARLAVVSVLDRGGRQADWARADNDGRWSVVLPGAGEYLVVCSTEGWSPRSELRQLSSETVTVLKLDEQLTVAGVVSRSGWPIDDALIVLTDASGESVGATRTNEDGHYELGLPPLGRYVLTALDPHSAVAQSEDVVISAQRRRFNLVLPEPLGHRRSATATTQPRCHRERPANKVT